MRELRGRWCIVIPAYREQGRIGSVVRALHPYGAPVVVVDDGSDDRTADEAAQAGAVVLRHPVNQGKTAALATGFRFAREHGYEFAVTMDGDGQHRPEDLPVFLHAYARGEAAVLIGNRMTNPEGMPWIRRMTNRFTSWLLSRRMGQFVPDTQCGFRLFRCDVAPFEHLQSRRFEGESEVLLRLAEAGIRIGSVPVRSVYGTERSKIRPLRDTWRFFRMLRRHRRGPKAWPLTKPPESIPPGDPPRGGTEGDPPPRSALLPDGPSNTSLLSR